MGSSYQDGDLNVWQMSNKALAPYSTFDVHFNMVIWEDPLETLRRYAYNKID
jgi:hypothetical protein